MRRQLRAQGGIMNTAPRKKFGIGSYFQKAKDKVFDRTRKLIPNELADVAVKAAPFVAPFYPGYAAIARGLGRFDQRGSISDALKQGALTYGFGKGIGKLGGASGSELGNVFGRQQYSMEGFKDKGLGRLFKGADAPKVDPKVDPKIPGTPKTEGLDVVREASDKVFSKIPGGDKLPSMVKQKLLVGSITSGASALYSYFTGAFEPQEPGESMEEYMARRNARVKQQMRGYMDSYYTPLRNPQYAAMSDEEKDKYIDSIVGQGMATGGRVGLANGDLVDPRMRNSLQENIRRNNAARAVNQMSRSFDFSNLSKYGINPKKYDSTPGPMRGIPAVKGMRDRIIQDIMNTQQPYSLTSQKPPEPRDSLTGMPESMMLPNMADGSMRSLAEQDAIRNRVLAAQEANKPTYQERLMGESWETLSDNDQYMIAQEYPGETPPRRNPNFVPNMDAGLSGQEIAEKYGIAYASGGRVGLAEGSDDMILPMKKPQVERFLTREEAEARNPAMFVDTTTSNPIPDNAAELEIAEVAKIMIGPGRSGIGEPEDGTMKGYQFFRTQYLPKKIKEISENYGLSRIEILKMIRAEMMKYSKPKKEMMNKGGLMRLNYMIGGEAKQMEAGAPPIMYSGNMDPNAQAGLPAVPGPMQMAEDGPEFDMRENGGFQPLGRQEGKDDVPAMLAKNEFVMTADAVRAAGGGSIQKGAQKMYDTMKKLESRVS